MKRYIYILFFIFATTVHSQPQRTYHWYFGGGAGIDFSSGQAVADTNGQVNTWEGCASISDENGNLLFYTDGSTVWNRNHQIMQNGTGLLGHWSSHQNSLIVPKPKNSNIYYIFTTDAQENNFQYGLRYSVVDMSLDNGLGAVTTKNILLVAPTHEQLAATYHANCEDIWVITHKRDEDKFYAFLISENGINSPVISEIGNATQLLYGCIGFEISPNGEKIVSGNYWKYSVTNIPDTVELFDFDKTSGMLINKRTLFCDTINLVYSFSHDSKKLFVGAGGNRTCCNLFQFDLTTIDINSTKQIVSPINPYTYVYDAQLSPIDLKIYFTNADNNRLPIIQNSNASGVACDFQENTFNLGGRMSAAGLPNFISSYFESDSLNCFQSEINNIILNEKIYIFPNPANDYLKIKFEYPFSIKISSITGFEIFSKNIESLNEIELNTNALPNGMYIITIISRTKTCSQKILIQHN